MLTAAPAPAPRRGPRRSTGRARLGACAPLAAAACAAEAELASVGGGDEARAVQAEEAEAAAAELVARAAEELCSSAEASARSRLRTCADVVPAQVDTLVIKRLAACVQEGELLRLLEERGPTPAAAVAAELLRSPDGSFSGTAFVRYSTPEAAQAALESLGPRPKLGGRRVQVEPQKSKGGRELEMVLTEEELAAVRDEIERFALDEVVQELALPSSFTSHQRKYAHSLAEQSGLAHTSLQDASGETYVHLSRAAVPPADRRCLHSRPKLHSAPSRWSHLAGSFAAESLPPGLEGSAPRPPLRPAARSAPPEAFAAAKASASAVAAPVLRPIAPLPLPAAAAAAGGSVSQLSTTSAARLMPGVPRSVPPGLPVPCPAAAAAARGADELDAAAIVASAAAWIAALGAPPEPPDDDLDFIRAL